MSGDELWVLHTSGISTKTPSYWFDFKDPLTARHFVVSVFDFVGQDRAEELATEVAADAEVRHEARQLTETGREHEITARHDAEAVPIVTVWRKS